MRSAWVRSLISAASYSAIRANMPKTSLPCAVVVSSMPLVSGHRSVNASAALAVCGSGDFAVQEGNEFACFDLDGFSTSAGGANVERGCGPVARWRARHRAAAPTRPSTLPPPYWSLREADRSPFPSRRPGDVLREVLPCNSSAKSHPVAVDMHEDTIDAYGWIPDTGCRIPDTGYRFTEVRMPRGGPGDPRRVPSQRVDLISVPECEVHCVRAGGLNVPPSG